MRVLVTGGAGFIGSHLVDRLVADGHQVDVLDDLSTGRLENVLQASVNLHRGSLLDRNLVERLVTATEATFHLGAAVGVPHILADALGGIRTNVEGTMNVLHACAARARPLVFTSSSEVYGKSARVPMRESDDRVLGATSITRWSYASSKALSEHAVLEAGKLGLPVCVLRYFNAYGPRLARSGVSSVVASFIRSALAGEPLLVHGDGGHTRCFTYVTDTARATAAALCAMDGKVINVGGAHEVTMLELAERIVRLCASKSSIVAVPYEHAFGQGFEDPPRRVPDTTRAKQSLHWQPQIDLDEGLARTIAWWRT